MRLVRSMGLAAVLMTVVLPGGAFAASSTYILDEYNIDLTGTQNSGRIAVCLTGGSSPKALYQLVATPDYRQRIPWDRIDWFIGDERLVPRQDPLHNMSMARRPSSTAAPRLRMSTRSRPTPPISGIPTSARRCTRTS